MENSGTGIAAVPKDANPDRGGSSTDDVPTQVEPLMIAATVSELKVNVVALQVGGAIVLSGIFMLIVIAFEILLGHVEGGGFLVFWSMPYILLAASLAVAGILFFACRNQHLGVGAKVFNWVVTNIYGISVLCVTWGVTVYFNFSAETVLTFSLTQMLIGSLLIFLAVP